MLLFVVLTVQVKVALLIHKIKNFDYPEKTLKYKHIRRISD